MLGEPLRFDYNSGLGFTIGGNNVLKQKQWDINMKTYKSLLIIKLGVIKKR